MSNSARVRRRPVLLITLAIIVVLGGAAVASLSVAERWLSKNVETIGDPFQGLDTRPDLTGDTEPEGGKSPMNLLLLGSDSRISAGDPSQWKAGAQRTDAIMLVHLPADRQTAQVVSIPRDSWVPIPGHGEAKINAAFSYGGPSLMIQTVEHATLGAVNVLGTPIKLSGTPGAVRQAPPVLGEHTDAILKEFGF